MVHSKARVAAEAEAARLAKLEEARLAREEAARLQAEAEAEAEVEAQSPDEDKADVAVAEAGLDEEQKPKKRRRRRRRRKSGGPEGEDAGTSVEADANAATNENAAEFAAGDPSQTDTALQDAFSDTASTQTEGNSLARLNDAVPVELNVGPTDNAEAVDMGEAATDEAPKKSARKRSTTPRKRTTKPVADEATATNVVPEPATEPAVEGAAETAVEEEPVKKPRRRRIKVDLVKDAAENTAQPETEQAPPVFESGPVPEVAVDPVVKTVAEPQEVVPTSAAELVLEVVKEVSAPEPAIEQVPTEPEAPTKPKRRGWWSLGK